MTLIQSSTVKTLVTVAFLASAAHAEVREIKSMGEVLDLQPQGETLYVFDLDNTLIQPLQQLGSDQWASWWMKKFESLGLSASEAGDLGVTLFNDVQLKTQVKTVEASTQRVFSEIQKSHAVLGLTARPLTLVERSHEQLAGVGIVFNAGKVALPEPQTSLDSSVKLAGGILFVGHHNNKGLVLKQYLQGLKKQFKNVVFVDDKRHHTENVNKALAGLAQVYALRYGAADADVARFNAEKVNQDWAYFKKTGNLR